VKQAGHRAIGARHLNDNTKKQTEAKGINMKVKQTGHATETIPQGDPFWEMIESINYDQPTQEERGRRLVEKMRAMSNTHMAHFFGRFTGSLARRHEPELREAAESRYGKKMNDDEAIAFLQKC